MIENVRENGRLSISDCFSWWIDKEPLFVQENKPGIKRTIQIHTEKIINVSLCESDVAAK